MGKSLLTEDERRELIKRQAVEIALLRASLMWAFDRLSVDGLTAKEQRTIMNALGEVLLGRPSQASSYIPNEWDDSMQLCKRSAVTTGHRP